MPYDPSNPNTQMINGQLYMWQPAAPADPTNEQTAYGGTPDEGAGSWVPATYSHPGGLNPLKAIAIMAALGAGGSAAVSGLGALGGAGGAVSSGAMPAATGGIPAGASIGGATALGGAASAAMPAAVAGIPAGVSIGGATSLGATGGGMGTAGTLSTLAKYGKLAGDVGSVLGKQQQGAAQGKVTQADLNQRQDQNALARYIAMQNAQNTAANTDLQRKDFENTNRSTTAKQALIGALLGGGLTPTSISNGKASGGLLQSLNGNTDALAAMKLLGQHGSQAQQTPLQFQGGQTVQPPAMSNLPQVDSGGFLSTLAKIGELYGAAGGSSLAGAAAKRSRGQYDINGQYLGE